MKRLLTAVLGTASAIAMASTAAAQTSPYELDPASLSMTACTVEMGLMAALNDSPASDAQTALADYADARANWHGSWANSPAAQAVAAFLRDRRAQRQTQVVYLEFNDADPTFQVFNGFDEETGEPIPFAGGVFPDYIFTEDDKAEIIEQLETTYALYNVSFTDVQPSQGDFSTIQVGANDENSINLAGGILFGRADNIDFGNNDRNDNAFADGTFWQLIAELDANFGTQNFQNFLDLPEPLTAEEVEEFRQIAVVNQSANTTAHELGHILGLRHHDSIGKPGDGLPTTGAIQPEDFIPVLETDLNADETTDHVMASGASVGLGLEAPVLFDRFFGEREANKLTFNERGRLTPEARTMRFGLRFAPFSFRALANPLVMGDNSGKRLFAKQWAVDASIDELGEEDGYALFLKAGDVFNAEIISTSDRTIEDDIFGKLTLSYSNFRTGELEEVAVNQTTFEGREPLLFDFTVPQTGFYELKVTAPDEIPFDGETVLLSDFDLFEEFGLGNYELFAYKIDARGQSRSRRFAWGW